MKRVREDDDNAEDDPLAPLVEASLSGLYPYALVKKPYRNGWCPYPTERVTEGRKLQTFDVYGVPSYAPMKGRDAYYQVNSSQYAPNQSPARDLVWARNPWGYNHCAKPINMMGHGASGQDLIGSKGYMHFLDLEVFGYANALTTASHCKTYLVYQKEVNHVVYGSFRENAPKWLSQETTPGNVGFGPITLGRVRHLFNENGPAALPCAGAGYGGITPGTTEDGLDSAIILKEWHHYVGARASPYAGELDNGTLDVVTTTQTGTITQSSGQKGEIWHPANMTNGGFHIKERVKLNGLQCRRDLNTLNASPNYNMHPNMGQGLLTLYTVSDTLEPNFVKDGDGLPANPTAPAFTCPWGYFSARLYYEDE